MGINSLETNINKLMELKNTTQELREAYTSFNSWIDQAEERISEIEDQINEIKWEGKIREKRVKRNEQSLQEIWDYVKRSNLHLIGVPECDGLNGSKLGNISGYYPGEFPQPSKAGHHSSPGNTETTTKIFLKKSNPKAHIVRFTRVEMKEKMLREARDKGWVTHKGKPIRLTADLSAETLQAQKRVGPIINILKEKNF